MDNTEYVKIIADNVSQMYDLVHNEGGDIKELRVRANEFDTDWTVISAVQLDGTVFKYAIFIDRATGQTITDGYN